MRLSEVGGDCRGGTPWPPRSFRLHYVGRFKGRSGRGGGHGVPPLQLPRWAIGLLIGLFALQACNRADEVSRGVVVVNAPQAGEIRRVLASEGMEIVEGQPIAEIAILAPRPRVSPSGPDQKQSSAAINLQAAQAEIESARSEVVRHEVEVGRLTSLVSSGQASQGDLDAERALYERAQQRLQKAKAAAQQAQTGLVTARQQSLNSPTAIPSPAEQIVVVNATATGTVSALNARVGERVSAGQPLATIRVR